MRAFLASLCGVFVNLRAGARLALFAPVRRQDFRLDVAQLLLFFVVSALVDNAADWIRAGPGATLDWAAFGAEAASFAVLLLAAAILAWLFSEASVLVALPIIVLASFPLLQIANLAPNWLATRDDTAPWIAEAAYYLLLAWFLALLWRSSYVALEPGPRRTWKAFAGALLLAVPLMIPDGVLPDTSWWASDVAPRALDATNPASEPVLALQRELQEEALGGLDDHTDGESDLYFVAFAPDGNPVWRSKVARAKRTMDEHWGTQRRSLAYLNDASTLTELPIATISHLREALDEIGSAIDADDDIVMVYVAGRSNADGSLRASLPPLSLVPLSGPGLSHLLTQAGIRWRIIIVAACITQPFVDALADDQTVVVAAPPQPSDCRDSSGLTGFSDTLFAETLMTSTPLATTFEAVKRKLDANGAGPVVHVGSAIAEQLARLRSTTGARASSRTQTVRG